MHKSENIIILNSTGTEKCKNAFQGVITLPRENYVITLCSMRTRQVYSLVPVLDKVAMAVHIVGRVSFGLGRRWFSCSTAARTSMCRALVYGSFGQPEDVVRLVPEWNYGIEVVQQI